MISPRCKINVSNNVLRNVDHFEDVGGDELGGFDDAGRSAELGSGDCRAQQYRIQGSHSAKPPIWRPIFDKVSAPEAGTPDSPTLRA